MGWDTLIAYWLGELDAAEEVRAEEHYIGCAQCSRRLEQLAALASGVRALARTSGVNMVINDEFLRRLSDDGLRVREYRVPANGSVNCTAAPEDDFVVGRLEAPLDDVRRVDVLMLDGDGNVEARQQDVPFMPDSGGVIVAPRVAWLRSMPAFTMRLRLLAVDEAGERPLGDYTFNHAPYTQQSAH
jgi:hypothetical protein